MRIHHCLNIVIVYRVFMKVLCETSYNECIMDSVVQPEFSERIYERRQTKLPY